MHVLITGGAGFIGSNLVAQCLKEGWYVDTVDDLSNGHLEFLPEGQICIQEDFAGDRILKEIRSGRYKVVFHIAAVPRVSYSVEHPLETNDVNVSKTLKLIEACRGNVQRVVFASSSSVYGGAHGLPTAEHYPKEPKSPYALQKSIIEDYLKLYSGLYGLDSACLRFFNVFGPNQLGDSPYATAVSAWLTAIKKGVPMRSDGDGTQSRDMCYVDNVVDACIRAGRFEGKLNAECFNVACGDRTTNNEILEALMKRYPDAQVLHAPWRAGDVMHTQADVQKALNVLKYVPVVRFWAGFDKTVEWYEQNWKAIKKMKLNT
jgi:nucleoside-diphosphate-sugar epimerase